MIRLIAVFVAMVALLLVMSGCQTMKSLYAEYEESSKNAPSFIFYGPPANNPNSQAIYPTRKGFGVTNDLDKIKACVGYEDVKRILRLIKRANGQEISQ